MKPNDVMTLIDCDLPLPAEVTAAAVAARALAGLKVPAPAPRPPDVRAVEAGVVTDCVITAEKGKPTLPDAVRLTEGRLAAEEWDKAERVRLDQARLLRAAAAEALANLNDLLGEKHVTVIHGLADELEPLMAEVRELVPLVRGLTAGVAIRAGGEVREAFTRFEDLVGRYSSIRVVQYLATAAAGGAKVDEQAYFSTFRNVPKLHPSGYQKMHSSPPWPTDDLREFLTWCVDNPHYELWVPTPAERDEEYEKVIGVKVAGRMGRDPMALAGSW